VPLFLAGVTLRLFEKLDLLALKALGGTSEQAGHYATAQNMALLPAVLSMSLAPVLLSSLGRELRSGDVGAARGLARDALRAVVLLMPLPAIIAGCAPEIIGMIFGPAFAPAATPLALLIFGSSAMLMISVTSAILTAADRAGLALALSVPLVPLAVVGHLVAVPAMGLAGAAVVTLAAASLGALAQLIAVHRQWGIRPAMPTIGRSATAGVFATALALLWPAPGALLLLKLPAAGLAALMVLGALGEFSPGEVAAARALLRPNGRLIAQVPNAACWQFRLLGPAWNGIADPRHLFNFRDTDLERLVESCGFEVIRRKYFSLRDNPAGLATSLAPSLDPMGRRMRRVAESSSGRLTRNLVYLALVLASLPLTALEAACGAGSTVMIEARKR